LGVSYNAYAVGGDPNAKDFGVRSLSLPKGFPAERLARRQALAAELDTFGGEKSDVLDGLDRFAQQALAIIASPRTPTAFDLHCEPARVRDHFGRNAFGQSLLLARRLIEAGVRFVSVQFPVSWDTHSNNFTQLKDRHLPMLDRGLSALFLDLAQRGLLAETLEFLTGEFGRTPPVDEAARPAHWPHA